MNLRVRGETRALAVLARHHPRDERAVAQAVVQRSLVRPVGSLFYFAKVGMVRPDAGVEDTRLDALAAESLAPQRGGVERVDDVPRRGEGSTARVRAWFRVAIDLVVFFVNPLA